jgi:hypothetical protein
LEEVEGMKRWEEVEGKGRGDGRKWRGREEEMGGSGGEGKRRWEEVEGKRRMSEEGTGKGVEDCGLEGI